MNKSSFKFDISILLSLFIFGFVSFYYVLDYPFFADDYVLLRNLRENSLSRFFIANWFGNRGQGGFYRPLVMVSLALNSSLLGISSHSFHLVNLLLHLAVVALVYVLTRLLFGSQLIASIAALIFLFHPSHFEILYWVCSRTDSLASLFMLTSLILLVLYIAKDRGLHYVVSIFLFILALLTKEIAAVTPALGIIVLYQQGQIRSRIRTTIPYFIVLGAYIAGRFIILGGMGGIGQEAPFNLTYTILPFLSSYIGWLTEPMLWFRFGPATYERFAFLIFLLLVLLLAAYKREYHFCILWMIISLLPVLNICRQQYLYLPSVGYSMLIGLVIYQWHQLIRGRKYIMGLTVIALACLIGFYHAANHSNGEKWLKKAEIEEVFMRLLPAYQEQLAEAEALYFLNCPSSIANVLPSMVSYRLPDKRFKAIAVVEPEKLQNVKLDNTVVFYMQGWSLMDIADAIKLSRSYQPWSIETILLNPFDHDFTHATVYPDANVSYSYLEIWSMLSRSTKVKQGTPIIELRFLSSPEHPSITLKAGIDTAEWAYLKPGLAVDIRHEKAKIAKAELPSLEQDSFPRITYQTAIPLQQSISIQEIQFNYIEDAKARFHLTKIILYGKESRGNLGYL